MTSHAELLILIRSGPLLAALSMPSITMGEWTSDWLWSLPIIAATVVFHSISLRLLNQAVSTLLKGKSTTSMLGEMLSVIAVGGTAFCCTVLHGLESFMWAFAYRMLGAIPAGQNAMLYSLNAMTSYGHTDISLQAQWQLMGALEALNGWILFGLTAAVMFNIIQGIWSHHTRSG